MQKYSPPPPTKLKFGIKHLKTAPPAWVIPTLSLLLILLGAVSWTISGDQGIDHSIRDRITHYITGLQMVITALIPFFGGKQIK